MSTVDNKKNELKLIDSDAPETSVLDICELQKSIDSLLLEITPGFINNINNLTSIMINYKKIRINAESYTYDNNLTKIFDKAIESNINLKNFLSLLRQDGELQILPLNKLIDKVISIFYNKLCEKNITCENDIISDEIFNVPQQLPYYIFITILFYLTEQSSDIGDINISSTRSESCIEIIFSRNCINPVLKANSIHSIYNTKNHTEKLISEHLTNCNRIFGTHQIKTD